MRLSAASVSRTIISIHALREEGDPFIYRGKENPYAFLSTPSARRATLGLGPPRASFLFLSTPSARRATSHRKEETGGMRKFLSTPSARRATSRRSIRTPRQKISIHALREEGDSIISSAFFASAIFLSTPSARRATLIDWFTRLRIINFYPRPPRGGRLW